MKIVILTATLLLALLVANAQDFCSTYINEYNRFRTECDLETHSVNITTCCDLRVFQFREISSISGVYTIRRGAFDTASAYCDMTTTDGGWVVIQRNRRSSTLDFNRNLTEYEEGFGNLNGDFWYGLQNMECLTQRGTWEMRIDYEFLNGTRSYIHYTSFRVDLSSLNYRLLVSGYRGVGGDFLSSYRFERFSTPDLDRDGNSTANCAMLTRSGFWHDGPNQCGAVNLNSQPPRVGVEVRFVEMKIRQLNCVY